MNYNVSLGDGISNSSEEVRRRINTKLPRPLPAVVIKLEYQIAPSMAVGPVEVATLSRKKSSNSVPIRNSRILRKKDDFRDFIVKDKPRCEANNAGHFLHTQVYTYLVNTGLSSTAVGHNRPTSYWNLID